MFSKPKVIDIIKKNPNISFYSLVKKINIFPNQNKAFSQFLNQMKKTGEIAFLKKANGFYIPTLIGSFQVQLKLRNDYGFVNFDLDNETKRAIIFGEHLNNAINNDLVLVKVFQEIDSDYYFAIVEQIIERPNAFIFGQIDQNKNFIPIDFPNKNYVFKFETNQLEPNSYVEFKIKTVIKNLIYLELVKTISKIDQPYADLSLLVASMKLDNQFNDDVLKEANLIPDQIETVIDPIRVDLRDQLIVTIDGEKTKDFDDAINVKKTDQNTFILGVHIADVAHYVKEGSAIDQQALSRATSIYLLDQVIPMLPEKLSNGICSLNPHVDRYTLSLEAEIDQNGQILRSKVFPSVINSKHRLTYKQVENYQHDPLIQKDVQLVKMLDEAYQLSKILSKVKAQQGYIDFEIEEPIIKLDQDGKTTGIEIKQRLSSEVLIENFMVLANEQVSQIVSNLKYPCIYRIHEAPSEEKFAILEDILKTINLNAIKIHHSDDPKLFANSVAQIKANRFDNFIKISLLKTMQKAKYARQNIGHFGLASKFYSHFTSPIRRYPDLALHRIIWELIIKNNKSYLENLEAKLDQVASISSQKEEEALIAERRVNDVKKAEFYQTKVNQILEGIIVSIQKFGIFVEFDDKVDALVHVSNLDDQECNINEQMTRMICAKKTYQLGQKVKVKILSTTKLEGKVDAKIVG